MTAQHSDRLRKYTPSAVEEATRRLTESMEELAQYAMGHDFHALWLMWQPWYRIWWHTLTGHRLGLAEFLPARERVSKGSNAPADPADGGSDASI